MATIIAMKGAKLNKNLSAPAGVIPSFTNNFTVSASDCNIPLGPTRLGPRRICIHAETFLSMITNTSPSMANKPITHTPAITISMTIVQIGLKVALNQLSINFDILEKLHITPTPKGALYIFNKKCYHKQKETCHHRVLLPLSPLQGVWGPYRLYPVSPNPVSPSLLPGHLTYCLLPYDPMLKDLKIPANEI